MIKILWLKIWGSHLTCKAANRCLNVCQWVEVVGRNKDGPLSFQPVLWIQAVKFGGNNHSVTVLLLATWNDSDEFGS